MPSPSTPAVRLYATDSPYASRTLKAKLIESQRNLAQQIVDGFAADWADYKARVGHIKGLGEAIQICDQIDQDERGN